MESQEEKQLRHEDILLIAKSEKIDSSSDLSDALAKQERKSKFDDKKRGESYRWHIHFIVVIGMYIIGLIMIVMVGIRAFHIVAPDKWRWLNDQDNHNIERIIFSGIILSLATKYFKHYKLFDDN